MHDLCIMQANSDFFIYKNGNTSGVLDIFKAKVFGTSGFSFGFKLTLYSK